MVRRGVRVALVGAPNAGKSSLLNALAGRPAAIVSDHPGTTRDAVEVALELGGYKVIVADTAGCARRRIPWSWRAFGGRRRTPRDADLTVLVLDAAAEGDAGTFTLPPWVDRGATSSCATRWTCRREKQENRRRDGRDDDATTNATTHGLSCETREGLDAFVEALGAAVAARVTAGAGRRERLGHHAIAPSGSIGRVRGAPRSIRRVGARDRGTPEVAAEELRLAARALGRVTGHVDVEELLDVIFTDFCIEK